MNRRNFLSHSILTLGGALGTSALFDSTLVPAATTAAELPRAAFQGRETRLAHLAQRLNRSGFPLGAQMHLMAFKESREMEIWLKRDDGKFGLFDVLPICAFSGGLGPKLAEGDGQTPEGYYYIWPHDLHPDSAYHLALDIGFPNIVEQRKGWTGSLIRIHGSCESIGCYSMGDRGVEVIYLLAEQAFAHGSAYITFGAYPFRPTRDRLAQERGHVWYNFWANIAGSYRQFMASRRVPQSIHLGTRYFFLTF